MRILYKPNEYSQQRQREKPSNIYPVLLAMEAQYYRERGHEVIWDIGKGDHCDKAISEPEGLPFLDLPIPDREFTRAKEYTSGNYKYCPGTHILSAIGCWHGDCTFCVERGKTYEVRPLQDVMTEILTCRAQGFREVFDDAATFPNQGVWFDKFIKLKTKLCPDYPFSCNVRMTAYPWAQMKRAGFRMVLFGLESANQYTLDMVHKGVSVEDVRHIEEAARAGLDCHIAVIFGYPWETAGEAFYTLRLVHNLLRKGYARTAQASFYTPKDGTPGNEKARKFIPRIYDVWRYPDFWYHQLKGIKDIDSLKYIARCITTALTE